MNEAEWTAFLEDRGFARRGMLEEALLYAYFERHPVCGVVAGVSVYRRRFEDVTLFFDRETAVGLARELIFAGVPYDGGGVPEVAS